MTCFSHLEIISPFHDFLSTLNMSYGHSAGQLIVRVCRSRQNLVCSIPIHRFRSSAWFQLIPFLVRALDFKLPRRHSEDDLQLEHGQLLPNAIAWSKLKCSPRSFDRIQAIALLSEPAFRKKIIGFRPAGRIAVNSQVIRPDKKPIRRILKSVGAINGNPWFTATSTWCGRVESQRFFDDSQSVWKLI